MIEKSFRGRIMTEFGAIFEDPMSVMVFCTITLGFIVAHAIATIWVTSHGKDGGFELLKTA
jgi:hypothetical protein